MAELSATLAGEPIAFRQIGKTCDALHIAVENRSHWVSFDRGGLDAVARWMNVQLTEAGAGRRIFTLETLGDEHCYIVCSPDDAEAMKRAGVAGIGNP